MSGEPAPERRDDLTDARDASSAEPASPAWHAEVLADTEARLRRGELEFIDWKTAKRMIRSGRF